MNNVRSQDVAMSAASHYFVYRCTDQTSQYLHHAARHVMQPLTMWKENVGNNSKQDQRHRTTLSGISTGIWISPAPLQNKKPPKNA